MPEIVGPTNNELFPPKDAAGVGIRAIEMVKECFDHRDELGKPKAWSKYYEYRRNKHWKTTKGDDGTNLASVNLLGNHSQKVGNMLTNNNPTFDIVQAGDIEDDVERALQIVQKTASTWWRDTEQQHVLEESIFNGDLYGCVDEKLSFNVETNFPHGEIEAESIDPFSCHMYPPRVKKMEKAEGWFHLWPMSVREAKRRWPDQADKIKGDLELLEDMGDEREGNDPKRSGVVTTLYNSLITFLSSETKQANADADEVVIIEFWAKDYSRGKDGKPLYTGNIRKVMTCSGGEIVLEDIDNPNVNKELPLEDQQQQYLYNRFPVSHTQSVTDPNSAYGIPDYEQLAALNLEVDRTLAEFTSYKNKAARLKLINPKDSGVSSDELDNADGILEPSNHMVAQGIRYMNPPQFPTDLTAALSIYKDFFHEVAGTFGDVAQGQKAGSNVIAYKAIAALLEQAAMMQRGKSRNFEKMIRERGRMWHSLAQSWYKTDRYIMMETGGEKENVPVNRETLNIPVKLSVVSGSTMPVSLIQKREEASGLFKMGALDPEELLKALDWPDYQQVLQRMKAGPVGGFLEIMGKMGFPPQVMQVLQQVSQTDPKKVEQALKMGEIPNFMQMMQQMSGQQQEPPPDPAMVKVQLEAQKAQAQMKLDEAELQIKAQESQAKIAKDMAAVAKEQIEAELVKEKILLTREQTQSEVTDRQIRVVGARLDQDNMMVNKAETVAKIENMKKTQKVNEINAAAGIAEKAQKADQDIKSRQDKGGYNEVGMSSNNQENK